MSRTCVISLMVFMYLGAGKTPAQGPRNDWYFDSGTRLPWAECMLYQEGGSGRRLSFMPLIVGPPVVAPAGSERFSRDVDVSGQIVFVGNGIVREGIRDPYGDLDVTDKVVMFCYDSPDSVAIRYGGEVPLSARIREAMDRGVAGAVLFSWRDPAPFTGIMPDSDGSWPDLPAITVNREAAEAVFTCAGRDPAEQFTAWESSGSTPRSGALIAHIRWRIDSAFETATLPNTDIRYRPGAIAPEDIRAIVDTNERAVSFLLDLFLEMEMTWTRVPAVYFRGYDSKYFYTHHLGSGFASDYIILMVYRGASDYGLTVHENAHTIVNRCWGKSSSFMDEGIARYAEAMATDPLMNHREVLRFIDDGGILPVAELLDHRIGAAGIKTAVGYPVAGSFAEFLIEQYGMERFREAYRLEGRTADERAGTPTWDAVYDVSLDTLEAEWRGWLESEIRKEIPR